MRNLTIFFVAMALLGTGAGQASAHFGPAALVNSWYQQYLHRPVDFEGLRTWTGHLRHGAPPLWVQANILGSEEYFLNHGACPNQYVAGLYADVLGRSAAPHEVHGWARQLAFCGNRVELAIAFLNAAQHELSLRAQPGLFAPPQPGGPRFNPPPPAPLTPDELGFGRRGPALRFQVSRSFGR